MSTDMAKNIFKDSSLNNSTNTTKKRYWCIVRSDRFDRFLKNCCNASKLPKRRETFLRSKLDCMSASESKPDLWSDLISSLANEYVGDVTISSYQV